MLSILDSREITAMAKDLFRQKRAGDRLDGWFIAKETELSEERDFAGENREIKKAKLLREVVKTIPLDISEFNIFAGTQDDAFARSYALINPSFKVEEFSGYCDPAAVFGDIEPDAEFTRERIDRVRDEFAQTEYAKKLGRVYAENEKYSHVASLDEIKSNEYNLNIPRYVDTFEEEEIIDIDQVNAEIADLKAQITTVEAEMDEYLKELGLK